LGGVRMGNANKAMYKGQVMPPRNWFTPRTYKRVNGFVMNVRNHNTVQIWDEPFHEYEWIGLAGIPVGSRVDVYDVYIEKSAHCDPDLVAQAIVETFPNVLVIDVK